MPRKGTQRGARRLFMRLAVALVLVATLVAISQTRTPQNGAAPHPCPVSGPSTTSQLPVAGNSPAGAGFLADRYGYNAHIEQQADPVRYVELIRGGGARTVRDVVDWSAVEPARGRFDWSEPDAWLRCAVRAGLHPLLLLATAPAWASGSSSQRWTPPIYPSDFGTFAAAVASRYDAGGTFWKEHPSLRLVVPVGIELWNEPNISAFWGGLKPDPAKFAAMVRSAYAAVKSVDLNLTVITGGLAPVGGYGDINCDGKPDGGASATAMNPLTFLQSMYAAGVHRSFDALGWHPYDYTAGKTAAKLLEFSTCSGWSEMGDTSPSARSIMMANEDGAKKIWVTEVGAPTCVRFAAYPCLSEAQQAALASQEIRLWRSWSWAGSFYWYDIRDDPPGDSLTTPEQHFGAVHADDKAKPSYVALKSAWSTG